MVKQDQDKYQVRFPDGMRDLLKEAAASNNRSINAEIIARLSWSLETENVVAAANGDPEGQELFLDAITKLNMGMQQLLAKLEDAGAEDRARSGQKNTLERLDDE